MRGAVWFFSAGRGDPLPGPHPQMISPRYGVWDDAGEGMAGPAFPVLVPLLGISRLLPPPPGWGRSAEGAGGVGEKEGGVWREAD